MTTINYFFDRLKSKSVKNFLINNISRDFIPNPILAVDDCELAGKPVQHCLKEYHFYKH
ncbi:MAG: hypothetical protein BWY38_02632 [Ignavibacteria bacterium ADurb.Bin266]|jgi:hypothetical protein|nr:MAG: hypothetical protein BWY38_02632 [Ignavibacteria bacterium ADurb.Bin266]